MTKAQLTTADAAPTYNELLEALEGLTVSLCPRKTVPVLEAAGYSADLFKAAHRNARVIITRARQ